MNDIKVIGQIEQRVIDKARAYNNLINETDFGDGKIKTVHEAIVQRLLNQAEELNLDIDDEPFVSLGNRQFSYAPPTDDMFDIPWYKHLTNFCQVEDKLQSFERCMSHSSSYDGFNYRIDVDPTSGTRTYFLNGMNLCDCIGTPTLQDFKNIFSEEQRQFFKDLEKELNR